MRTRSLTAVTLLPMTFAVQAAGLASFNQSSFARAAVMPILGQGPVLAAGSVESNLSVNWTNEFFQRSNAREQLTLDSETLRVGLAYRRGIGKGLEWSAELPLLFTGGGVQDGAIEGWHSAFGLPNNNREDASHGRYLIRYVRDGVTLIDLDKGRNGLGDARLGLGYALADRWALRAVLQVPTGSKAHLTGGHWGAALWSDYGLSLGESDRATLDFSLGVSVAANKGPLSDQQRPVTGLAGVALRVPLLGPVDAIAQLHLHTKLYKGSAFEPLNRAGAPLLFGLSWPVREAVVDLAITEDASVNASPDFGLLLAVKMRLP